MMMEWSGYRLVHKEVEVVAIVLCTKKWNEVAIVLCKEVKNEVAIVLCKEVECSGYRLVHKEVKWSGYCPVHKALCYQSRSAHRLCMCMHSCTKRHYIWGASACGMDKANHLTAFCEWDISSHLPVTPAQLMRLGIDWNAFCTVSDFTYITSRPPFLGFTDCSCTHIYCPRHTKDKCTATCFIILVCDFLWW